MPAELEEAAIVDGAGFFRVFSTIMLPLSMPVTATVAILTFLATWNAFFLPARLLLQQPGAAHRQRGDAGLRRARTPPTGPAWPPPA